MNTVALKVSTFGFWIFLLFGEHCSEWKEFFYLLLLLKEKKKEIHPPMLSHCYVSSGGVQCTPGVIL